MFQFIPAPSDNSSGARQPQTKAVAMPGALCYVAAFKRIRDSEFFGVT
jgi:hypothetical protein